MKRLGTIASLALLACAVAATGAYAAAPKTVMAVVHACCEACGVPCPCCP